MVAVYLPLSISNKNTFYLAANKRKKSEMINATELRIGNFILLDAVAKKVVGVSLDLDDENNPIIQLEHTNPIPNTDFEYSVFEINEDDKRVGPIPINLKILANCGFEEKKQGEKTKYTIKRNDFSFSILHDSKLGAYMFEGGPGDFEYHHIHQLQNLFHALTGEELIGGS